MNANEFYSARKQNLKEHSKVSFGSKEKLRQETEKLMIDFARIKVHEALTEVKKVVDSGNPTCDDWYQFYPLTSIK